MNQFPKDLAEAIEWLSSIGASSDGGVTRTLYSNPWREAQDALKGWMDALGFKTKYDSIGNLFGRVSAGDPNAPTILVGSHVDTVVSGGKYDGAYGIIAAILAIDSLKKHYGKPVFNLEVVSLCEEEGSRFPLACSGSGMITGSYSFDNMSGLTDLDGISFAEAMERAGFIFSREDEVVRNDIHSFIELHIEQGPTLENFEKKIGIVETIVGQKRLRITVNGISNHAGTTLMMWRKDPLCGAAVMINKLYSLVDELKDENLVATVGQLSVVPNISNVIPNQVVFTVDVRHPDAFVLDSFCSQFSMSFLKIAESRGLGIIVELYHEVLPVGMTMGLCEIAKNTCVKKGVAHHVMNSGAGHDAQLFAKICPTLLLFVPSHNGISHSPLEYTSTEDLETGLSVLTDVLHQLAYKQVVTEFFEPQI